ncbi:MAG: hypothetical protein Greene041679_447 [Parcubacteria group bacterium Greene0416_79]|nr:MAG: hypothetical protein Greene041679_447 [Parcubacteria group bacterium Greene0416_79]
MDRFLRMSTSPHTTTAWTIVGVAIIAGGYFLFSSTPLVPPAEGVVTTPPAVSKKQLLGEETLGDREALAVGGHKERILERIASPRPLTNEEKGAIGSIMLTQAHLYNFSGAEREAIFAALQNE